MFVKEINSVQNALIKHIVVLESKSKERKDSNTFVVEGKRELSIAIKGGYEVEKVLFLEEIIAEDEVLEMFRGKNAEIIRISKEVYQKISYRTSTEGVLGVCRCKNHEIGNFNFKGKNPLVLVMEATEKPGNIGAMLRTCDAARVDAVFIANPKTDLYNPNVIRSSVGGIFTNRIFLGSSEEIIKFLKDNEIGIYCAMLQASVPYYTVDFRGGSAIVVGTEDVGLSQIWRENSTQNIIIPMKGVIDSMNVSVSASILTFEAMRQREQR